MATEVTLNHEQQRYEIHVDGTLAGLVEAIESDGIVTMPHTEVNSDFEGQGMGTALIREALADIRARGLKVVPECPFVERWFARHDEDADLLA